MKHAFATFVLVALLFNTCLAQIDAPGHNFSTKTDYHSGQEDDVFCFPSGTIMALEARHPSASVTNPTYEWTSYNPATRFWDIPMGSDEELTGIAEGGYQVVLNKGLASEVILRCWVFVPEPIGVPAVAYDTITCDPVRFRLKDLVLKDLVYYDQSLSNHPAKKMNYTFHWISSENYIDTTTTQPSVVLDIYYGHSSVNATVGGLGLTPISATPAYIEEAKAVKAGFTYKVLKDTSNHHELDLETSAVIDVNFSASPLKDRRSMGDNLLYDWTKDGRLISTRDSIVYPFDELGLNTMVLKVTNEVTRCMDTCSYSITISNTKVFIPNVFTPNGDGKNDEFKVAYRSVKKFSMVILNRWGRVVYKSNDLDKGWDGRVGGKKAAPGVYFYDVSWEGFEKGSKGHKTGFLHLITDRK